MEAILLDPKWLGEGGSTWPFCAILGTEGNQKHFWESQLWGRGSVRDWYSTLELWSTSPRYYPVATAVGAHVITGGHKRKNGNSHLRRSLRRAQVRTGKNKQARRHRSLWDPEKLVTAVNSQFDESKTSHRGLTYLCSFDVGLTPNFQQQLQKSQCTLKEKTYFRSQSKHQEWSDFEVLRLII